MKKQDTAKLLKINELKSHGSAVRRKKMLKMKDDPTMCMKTHGLSTECPSTKHTFLIKLDRFYGHYGRFSSLAGAIIWGRKASTERSHSSVLGILRPAKVGRTAVSMIRLETSRSEQVHFVAGFPIDLAPKVLGRQQPRTCVRSPRAGRTYGKDSSRTDQTGPRNGRGAAKK